VFIALFVMVTRRHAISQTAGFPHAGQRDRRDGVFLLTAGVP